MSKSRQGWIKFGEPALDVALKNPIRRAIQPGPDGWCCFRPICGTAPCRSTIRRPRTTIAFDVVPKD